ncbi:MAG TPA: response regulator transcription factor [Chthoniobacterales bacterium]|nr:response regulator transcription factor [Chthoniobacterales bacterium]
MQLPHTSHSDERDSISLVIVDDHIFMRDLMARTIARQRTRYAVLAAVGTAAEAKAACSRFQPDLLILDINLPDQNGIDALPELKQVAPSTRILLCTGYPTDDRIADLASAGAHGFVEKTNTWDDFLQAVERVGRGEYYFCSRNVKPAAPASPHSAKPANDDSAEPYLTTREKEIITLIAEGLISKEIGNKLHISVATVETHRTNLMKKLGVRNVAGLVKHAFHSGLVKPRLVSARLGRPTSRNGQ